MGKVRTQIQLEPEQYRALKDLAHRERISLSEAVRRILDQHFQRPGKLLPEAVARALSLVGAGRDPCSDVSSRHDHYLTVPDE